jgi:hypothetical protein
VAAARYGFVQSQDPRPRRHVTTFLRAQGLRPGPNLAFLSDRDTRLRITLPAAQPAQLWQLLDERLTDEVKATREAVGQVVHTDVTDAVGATEQLAGSTLAESALGRTQMSTQDILLGLHRRLRQD